jgi:xanthine dehydrogenase accessory factor
MVDGQSRLISITPKDLLSDLGVSPGEDRAGVLYARNSCPSQGTMDIFVEPVLPTPRLLIFGSSPVAVALASLAPRVGFAVTVAAPAGELGRFEGPCTKIDSLSAPGDFGSQAYIVISTQGAGDRIGLKLAANTQARYRSFVGSRRKAETLRQELAAEGVPVARLAAIKAPAGLDIGAISTEEIALSILAEIVAARRKDQHAVASVSGETSHE